MSPKRSIYNSAYEAQKEKEKHRVLNEDGYRQVVEDLFTEIDASGEPYNPLVKNFFEDVVLESHERDKDHTVFSVSLNHENKELFFPAEDWSEFKSGQKESEHAEAGNFPEEMEHPVSEIPLLCIEDPRSFVQKMSDLVDVVDERYDDLRWLRKQQELFSRVSVSKEEAITGFLKSIWYNATPYDFRHPEQFIDKEIAFIGDETFQSCDDGVRIGNLPTFQRDLYIQRTQSGGDYETPYILEFDLVPKGETKPVSDAGTLPRVRYGVETVDEGEEAIQRAHIYAIQMRKLLYTTEQEIIDEGEEIDSTAKWLTEFFKSKWDQHEDEFTQAFGAISEDILNQGDDREFSMQLLQFFQDEHPDIFELGFDNVCHRVRAKLGGKTYESQADYEASLYYGFAERLINLHEFKGKITNLEEKKEIPKERKKLNRKMYKLNKGVSKVESERYREYQRKRRDEELAPDEYYPENISDVSPSALISLTATLSMLKQEGIEEVVVPAYLPLRWQNHVHKDYVLRSDVEESERIQRNVTDKFIRTFRRVAHHIEGVEVDAFPDDAGGFLKMRLDTEKDWESNTAILQEVLDVVAKESSVNN